MTQYTEEQVEEMMREAVQKTERSFGGTFKRLKSENEELTTALEAAMNTREEERRTHEERIVGLEDDLGRRTACISELAVGGEIERQLRETGPLPERFIDRGAIGYDDDPDTLRANVSHAIETGRREFEDAVRQAGMSVGRDDRAAANPTNPPSRDTATARDLRRAGARETLSDMRRRGLLR